MSRCRSSLKLSAPIGVFALVLLAGCAGNKQEAKLSELRSNPSPELDTMYERRTDMDNALTVTADENWRMFNQDLGRFWLLDRPSRLTPEPVPH
jgi:hypothetical protein